MNARYFLDTNIFVYAFDSSEPEKKERSLALIADALQTRDGLISTQVVQEFLNVATRKFSVPLRSEDSRIYLLKVLNPLCQVYPDLALYQSALEVMQGTNYAFYDALILAGAQRGNCEILFSEDLQAGQKVGGVKIINPYV